MKTNSEHTSSSNVLDLETLRLILHKEKEALVSMFLTNASLSELAAQYKVIDELNEKILNFTSD